MTTLRDRLADLAADAPAAAPVPELWDRGVRYRRRRRSAAAVVMTVAAVALLALGSATWLRSPSAVEPLPADSPAGLPDRLHAPSPWLPGTDDAGPLGTIAVLIPATRGTWSGMEDGRVVGRVLLMLDIWAPESPPDNDPFEHTFESKSSRDGRLR